jgi:hypothetical protein
MASQTTVYAQRSGELTIIGTAITPTGNIIRSSTTVTITDSQVQSPTPCYTTKLTLSSLYPTPDEACSAVANLTYYWDVAGKRMYVDDMCMNFESGFGYLSDNGGTWYQLRGGVVVGSGICGNTTGGGDMGGNTGGGGGDTTNSGFQL